MDEINTEYYYHDCVEEDLNDDLKEQDDLIETLIEIEVGMVIANKYQKNLGGQRYGKGNRISRKA